MSVVVIQPTFFDHFGDYLDRVCCNVAMLQCCKQFFVFSPYFFCIPFIFRTFAGRKQSDGSSLPVCRHDTQGERKVRTAQGSPLPNVEAVREG